MFALFVSHAPAAGPHPHPPASPARAPPTLVRYLQRSDRVTNFVQVRLLNFERPSDALEYRPPPPVPRRFDGQRPSQGVGRGQNEEGRAAAARKAPLSSESVKEVLRLRVDFQREAIDALEL